MVDNCIFCKIVARQIPSSTVYEDEELMVFKDIQPHAPVHLLVIPKTHIGTLSDCGPEHAGLLGRMLALAPRLAAEQGIAPSFDASGKAIGGGYKTLINAGPDGGQEVYHLHLHVFGGPHPWRHEH